MEKKTLIWSIVVVFALIIIATGIILFVDREVERPDPINVQCAFSCETEQRTAFCFVERKVTDDLKATCYELVTNPQYSHYNVQPCPAISCEKTEKEQDQSCAGLGGSWEAPTEDGNCPPRDGFFSRKRTPSDEPPVEIQICCFYYE